MRTPGQLYLPLVNMAVRRPGRAGGGVPLSPSRALRAGAGWPAGQLPTCGDPEGGPGGCRVGRARRGLGWTRGAVFSRLGPGEAGLGGAGRGEPLSVGFGEGPKY